MGGFHSLCREKTDGTWVGFIPCVGKKRMEHGWVSFPVSGKNGWNMGGFHSLCREKKGGIKGFDKDRIFTGSQQKNSPSHFFRKTATAIIPSAARTTGSATGAFVVTGAVV